jgi:hypothetical protein
MADTTKVCKNPIYYFDRKAGKGDKCGLQKRKLTNTMEYKKMEQLKHSGREFISNDEVFQDIETRMTNVQYNVLYDTSEKQMTYIYVISKSIENRLTFESNKITHK